MSDGSAVQSFEQSKVSVLVDKPPLATHNILLRSSPCIHKRGTDADKKPAKTAWGTQVAGQDPPNGALIQHDEPRARSKDLRRNQGLEAIGSSPTSLGHSVFALFTQNKLSCGEQVANYEDVMGVLKELDKSIKGTPDDFDNFVTGLPGQQQRRNKSLAARASERLRSSIAPSSPSSSSKGRRHRRKALQKFHLGSKSGAELLEQSKEQANDGMVSFTRFKRIMLAMKEYNDDMELKNAGRHGQQSCCTISPDRPSRMAWEAFTMILVLYIAVIQPFRIGFDSYASSGSFIFYFEWMIDIVFIIDLVINFRTGYVDVNTGKIVLRGFKIAKNYLAGWFIIDFASAVPWDLVIQNLTGGQDDVRLLKTVRLVRLIRLGRLAKVQRSMGRLAEAASIEREHRGVIAALVMLTVFSHSLACLWAAIPRFTASPQESISMDSWYTAQGMLDEPALTQYTAALYWAVSTVTTVGYGDITPKNTIETVFCSVAMILAGTFYGYLVASISAYFVSSDEQCAEYEDKMRKLKSYMRLRKYPYELSLQVKSYFMHFYQQTSEFKELAMLKQLPHDTSVEVSRFLCDQLLANHYVFAGIEARHMTEILGLLCPRQCRAQQNVEVIGGKAAEMYILNRGNVNITNCHGDVRANFRDGQTFMEYALVSLLKKHVFNAVATVRTDLYSIKAEDFEEKCSLQVLALMRRSVRQLESGRATLGHSLIDAKPTKKEKVEQYKRMFAKFDYYSAGIIAVDGLSKSLKALPGFKEIAEAEIMASLCSLDTDESGSIDFNEFMNFVKHVKEDMGMDQAFSVFNEKSEASDDDDQDLDRLADSKFVERRVLMSERNIDRMVSSLEDTIDAALAFL